MQRLKVHLFTGKPTEKFNRSIHLILYLNLFYFSQVSYSSKDNIATYFCTASYFLYNIYSRNATKVHLYKIQFFKDNLMSRFWFGCKIIFSCDHIMEFISFPLKPFGVSLYGDCFQPPSEHSQLHFL